MILRAWENKPSLIHFANQVIYVFALGRHNTNDPGPGLKLDMDATVRMDRHLEIVLHIQIQPFDLACRIVKIELKGLLRGTAKFNSNNDQLGLVIGFCRYRGRTSTQEIAQTPKSSDRHVRLQFVIAQSVDYQIGNTCQ